MIKVAGRHAAEVALEEAPPTTEVATPTSWWSRIKAFEPAILRGVVVALVSVAALWGLDLTEWGDKITNTWALLFPLIAILQAWWTRQSVVPVESVVARVERSGSVVAGNAAPVPSGSQMHVTYGDDVVGNVEMIYD